MTNQQSLNMLCSAEMYLRVTMTGNIDAKLDATEILDDAAISIIHDDPTVSASKANSYADAWLEILR
jgi:hypothetical protein